jgi:hypothetical protein
MNKKQTNTRIKQKQSMRERITYDESIFIKCQLSRPRAKIILNICAMNVNRIAIISAPADQSIRASKRS